MTHAIRRSVWGRANQAETAEPHLLSSVCRYEDFFFRLLTGWLHMFPYASERAGGLR